ncbi:hypothetical protein BHM03_00021142 [Ensete ventricosum]|uniref:Uncharacterized protein n=1 Tax=Ensete ventricosum TaxID=4639 RepID=A0A426Z842_ENSVE|nr:hypothetical protein B296_00022539 [Ensete ventricosum]RZR92760.1 hypothetical protein BHM03_00021142 [Ensete ventricosum]
MENNPISLANLDDRRSRADIAASFQVGVMVAWTGIEHFLLGRFDPPPPADEPEDAMFELRPRWPLGEEYSQGKSEARSLKRARVFPSLTSMIQGSVQN